jgi:hypothetical protein
MGMIRDWRVNSCINNNSSSSNRACMVIFRFKARLRRSGSSVIGVLSIGVVLSNGSGIVLSSGVVVFFDGW